MKSKFRLNTDRVVNVHGVAPFSNANITDEKALKVLKANPNAIKLFSDFPENWRELTGNFDAVKSMRDEKKKEVTEEVNQNELAQGDKPDENVDSEKSRRELLEEKSNKELKELCSHMELPESEWKKLNAKAKLVDYILEKTK